MNKNWYILYTKRECEKKVSSILTKMKIKNFYPVNCKEVDFRRKKMTVVPLFTSYIFINTTEDKLAQIRQMDRVINLVFWKNHAAIVSENEINAMKEFAKKYRQIKLIPSNVVENAPVSFNDRSYSIEGNVLSLRNKIIKMKLPSLGVIMVAETDRDAFIGKEPSFGNMQMIMQ
ncbi:MAG: transcription termination/antitermination protein NusG [Ginsengibacter sp.]